MNHIRRLQKVDGTLTNDRTEMEEIAISYFKVLFKSKGIGNLDHILLGVTQCIIKDMNQGLLASYTVEEILEVLNSMRPSKALGFDYLPVLLY